MNSANEINYLVGKKNSLEIHKDGVILTDHKSNISKKIEYHRLSSIFYEEATIIRLGVIGFKNKLIKNHIDYFYFSFFQRKEAEKLYSTLEVYVADYKKRKKLENQLQEKEIEPNKDSKNESSSKILRTLNNNICITASINKTVKSKSASSMILKSIYNEFIALDVETTGLDPEQDRIIEISLIKFKDGNPIDSINSLINPKIKIPKEITELTGITNEMVENENTIEDILSEIINFIGTHAIVAHNAIFDIKFLRSACRRFFDDENYYIENPIIDTLKLSRLIFKDLPNHKLPTVLDHINYSASEHHRSYADALGAAQIYLKYCDFYNQKLIEKQKDFSQDELKCYEIVKEILLKNNKSITYLKYGKAGNYIDIRNVISMLKIKLKGKKSYVLTNLDEKIIDPYRTQFAIEEAAKSESGNFRILINSPEDIYKLENLILESFKKSEEHIKSYRENVLSAEKRLQEYLMSV
ncbi:exonuclease domain-containing protein [Defluviitalea saccharophila]|uniref:Exonuclease domain-containing protein n=1 Tax=Defluviitalea saccharophila TaxID=879970 RepID=A0ABZ2Y6K3_9FIRM